MLEALKRLFGIQTYSSKELISKQVAAVDNTQQEAQPAPSNQTTPDVVAEQAPLSVVPSDPIPDLSSQKEAEVRPSEIQISILSEVPTQASDVKVETPVVQISPPATKKKKEQTQTQSKGARRPRKKKNGSSS